jgi:hypothetical protein
MADRGGGERVRRAIAVNDIRRRAHNASSRSTHD